MCGFKWIKNEPECASGVKEAADGGVFLRLGRSAQVVESVCVDTGW